MGKRFEPKTDMFTNALLDIMEIGRANDVEVTKISIEGIYKEEIFRVSYSPKEEGYDEGDNEK